MTKLHLFFLFAKFKKIQANDDGMKVKERISPIPSFLGEPKSTKSKTRKINASMIHVANPTIQKMIYTSVLLILFLGMRIKINKSVTTTMIGNHNPFAPRSRLLSAVESMVSPPKITKT